MLWFRAFKRPTAAEVVAVLRQGDQPNPAPTAATRRNEGVLGIHPPRVYYYLGRTIEAFGDAAVALDHGSLDGEVSPFDTGGLVDHIPPVRDWQANERTAFLTAFTGRSAELPNLLAAYPGKAVVEVRSYLLAHRPTADGPGDLWPGKPNNGTIWRDGTDSRAWTWECRVVPPTIGQGGLRSWSCTAVRYREIRRYAEALTDEVEIQAMEALLAKYVRGGTSVLVQQLLAEQESAV